jgi:hypothetical protein
MGELASSLYVVSTAAFALVAVVVGIRLLALSAETGQMAERLLGFGLLGTAGLGYGVMMIATIGRTMLPDPSAEPAVYRWLYTTGWIFHNIGVMCVIGFVVHVFRQGVVWARALAAVMWITLWVGWGLHVWQGGMADGLPRGGYWIAMAVVGTYPFWTATESFAYYTRMRKRVALGLGDRLVANRFLLWGLASLTTAGTIWVVNIPSLAGASVAGSGGNQLAEICLLVTGVLGTGAIVIYWLTFFPPAWYRRQFSQEGV